MGTLIGERGGSEKQKGEKGAVTVFHTEAIKGNFKRGGGRGSKKRKGEKGAVTVCHTGATKGNFKRGRRRK
jgi:hypothetical protein